MQTLRRLAVFSAVVLLSCSALLLLNSSAAQLWPSSELRDELLDHAKESRSAILGDGYIDSGWSQVWSRKPAAFKAVSQELSSYDALSPNAKGGAASKADKELDAYSQVYAMSKKAQLKAARIQHFKAKQEAAKRKAEDKLYPWQWGEKQQLADARAHDKELSSYSDILGFPDRQKAALHKSVGFSAVRPASPEQELKSYELFKGPHRVQKAQVTSPAKELHAYNILPDNDKEVLMKAANPAEELKGYDILPSGKGESKVTKPQNPVQELQSYSDILSFSEPKANRKPKVQTKGKSKAVQSKTRQGAAASAAHQTSVAHQTGEDHEAKNHKVVTKGTAQALHEVPEKQAVAKTQAMVQNLLDLTKAEGQAKASSAEMQAKLAPHTVELAAATQELAQQVPETIYVQHKHQPAGVVKLAHVNSAEVDECEQCLSAWSDEALACVQRSCTGLKGMSGLDKAQLLLNNDIAAKLEKVLGSNIEGNKKRFMLVNGFVKPVGVQNEALPSWVEVRDEDGAIEGLGLASGKTNMLHLGDRVILSGQVAHAVGSEEVFDEVLKPLMRRQEVLNQARGSTRNGKMSKPVLLTWAEAPAQAVAPKQRPALAETHKHRAALSKGAQPRAAAPRKSKQKLSSDPILRRLQLKARDLRRELKGKSGHSSAQKNTDHVMKDSSIALTDVLDQKERELQRDEKMAKEEDIQQKSVKHVNQGVGATLEHELQTDENRLQQMKDNAEMNANKRRLIEEQTKRANLQQRHAVLVATLQELQKHLGKGPWSKYITEDRAHGHPRHRNRLQTPKATTLAAAQPDEVLKGAQHLLRKARALADTSKGDSGLDTALGKIEGLLQYAGEQKDSRDLGNTGHRLQSLISNAIDEVQKNQVGGPRSKAGILRQLLARDRARKSQLLQAIDRVRTKQAQLGAADNIPTDLLQEEKLHKLEAAVVRDENVLDKQDYVPPLHPTAPSLDQVRKGRYIRPEVDAQEEDKGEHALQAAVTSSHVEGLQEQEQDQKLRSDVSALVDAAKVADPKQYDAMLKAAIKHESNYLSSFQEAQSFANQRVDNDLATADQVFSTPNAHHSQKSDPVKRAMQAAQRDAREMHLHFKKEKEEAKQEKAWEKEKRREEKKSKNYLPGIGFVEKGGAPSLVDELWRHHRIPVADAVKQAEPQQSVRSVKKPKLDADGFLRSSVKKKIGVNTKEPSAWKLAQKDAQGAIHDSEQVGGGISKALDSLLGGLTRDSVKKPVGQQSIQGNSVWNYI